MKIKLFAPIFLGLASLLSNAHAQEASYPSKPVKVIVPFAAGGAADVFARMVSTHLSKTFGQPFVVENVGGAGGAVGLAQVARAPKDGYVIGLGATGAIAIGPTLTPGKLGYDPIKDLAPISQVSEVPNVLVVNPSRVQARTVPDLIRLMKSKPDGLVFASAGIGSTQHLSAEMFAQMTGTKIVHVPYKGSAPMMTDLVGGQVDAAFDNGPLVISTAKSGKLALLGYATPQRIESDPNVSAIAETVPRFRASAWHGFIAPAGTPPAVISKLSGEIQNFMKQPETVKKMTELGAIPVVSTPKEFETRIASEITAWKEVIQKANIKAE